MKKKPIIFIEVAKDLLGFPYGIETKIECIGSRTGPKYIRMESNGLFIGSPNKRDLVRLKKWIEQCLEKTK